MANVAQWLAELGLESYTPLFDGNHIDWETLPDLSDDDLKEIGVVSLGHRKKILRALTKLSDKAEADDVLGADDIISVDDSERRQITVMFCDLVGSTALSTKLDAEDMDNVIRRYQETVTPIVNEFGGHIARFAGDGILCYFGYPLALEQEAERALRAALKACTVVDRASFYAGVHSQVRIGIATGEVVVGGVFDKGRRYESMVTGETPNLAARLQGLAQPGGIAICDATRKLAGDTFEYVDKGGQNLKGFDSEMRAWVVVGFADDYDPLSSPRQGSRKRQLFGREQELQALQCKLADAKSGNGQCVVLSGEAGIGKSSLIHAAVKSDAHRDMSRVRMYCEPHSQNTPFHPLINCFNLGAGIKAEDWPEHRQQKLEEYYVGIGLSDDYQSSFVMHLLGVDSDQTRLALTGLSPQRIKEKTIEACVSHAVHLSKSGPLLVVFEDLHWADPSSLDFLQSLHRQVADHPILLLLATRPDEKIDWLGEGEASLIELQSMNREQQLKIINSISGDVQIPQELIEKIIQKSDGVPLYLEEITKSIMHEYEDSSDAWSSSFITDQEDFSVPDTLRNSVMARLDRLSSGKDLALMCSVIDRDFNSELVSLVSGRKSAEIQTALQKLVDAEIIVPVSSGNLIAYRFRHALVKDAAYDNLLRSRRKEIHHKIAKTLIAYFPQSTSMEPERLAHHYTEAGEATSAIENWLKAGQNTLHKSSSIEAVKHLSKGLSLLEQIEDTEARDRIELQVQMTMGPALIAIKGFAAPEVETTYMRSRELAEMLSSADELFPITRGLMSYHTVRAEYDKTLSVSDGLLDAVNASGNDGQQIELLWNLGSAKMWLGQLSEAKQHFEQAESIYDKEKHAPHAYLFGQDPGIASMTHHALLLNLMGHYDQARELEEKIQVLTPLLDHAFTLVQSNGFLLACYSAREEYENVLATARKNVELCTEQGFPVFMAMSLMYLASVTAKQGDEGWGETFHQGFEIFQMSGAEIANSQYLILAAECHLAFDEIDQGLSKLKQAKQHIEACSERVYEPAVLITEAKLLYASGEHANLENAENLFREAAQMAGERGLQHYTLLAWLNLVTQNQQLDKSNPADDDALAQIYHSLPEGRDIAAMQRAASYLQSVGLIEA